ncbi:MAG: hypothetical protein HY846_10430 [Nitrosomonadales bacterium]|nr:hypothetical protein [Nitrosomonadales bacterium]
MKLHTSLYRLVEIGRSGNFAGLTDSSELQCHGQVYRLADIHRNEVVLFAKNLSGDDRIAFVKSIAMLEHGVGSLGSVTNLQRLLPLISDSERNFLDWILRNTTSYWYYAHGARSVEQLDIENAWRAALTAENIARDMQRQLKDKERIAEAATRNLFNAIRRGDVKAVRALISKGADVMVPAPDGLPLVASAAAKGFDAIVNELRNAGAN